MPRRKRVDEEFKELPACVIDYVGRIARMIGYSRTVRREVQAELLGHFADALRDCASPEERQARAERLVVEFGDPHLLAILCRRAKKRCRSFWLKAIGGMRMLTFLFVSMLTVYAIVLSKGEPRITSHCSMRLNWIGRPHGPAVENAWPHYEKALSLYVEPNNVGLRKVIEHGDCPQPDVKPFSALELEDQQAIKAWIAQNGAAWQEFLAATRQPYHRRLYHGRTETSKGPLPPLWDLGNVHIDGLTGLADVALWKCRWAFEEGRSEEGIECALAVARAGAHWQSSAMLEEQLTGLWMAGLAHNEILYVLCHAGPIALVCADLQDALSRIYGEGYPVLNVEGERLCILDLVQRSFTEGGWGGGHIIRGRIKSIVLYGLGDRATWMTRVVLSFVDLAGSMIHARRDRTVAKVNELFDEIDQSVRLKPYYRHMNKGGGIDERRGTWDELRHTLAYLLLPDEQEDSELVFRGRALHEATVAILALKQYRCSVGRYPDHLPELTKAGYVDELPIDPYGNGPLVYKRVGDGFLLYSVGPDFVDEGGRRGVDDEGQAKAWADNGDMVFWPLEGALP